MPLLGALLAGLFASLAEFFAKWLTKKVAFGAAAVTVFATLTTALFAVAQTAASALIASVPSGLDFAFWLVNTSAMLSVMSVVVSLDAAIALYRWNVSNLRLVTGGS